AVRDGPSGLDLADGLADALREVHAARADADQRQILGPLVVLEDLVRDADQGALDAERVHHLPPAVGAHRRPPDTKKPPRFSREACSCATEIVGVMREPFPPSAGQVKRCRNVSGGSPSDAATERLTRLRPSGLAHDCWRTGSEARPSDRITG